MHFLVLLISLIELFQLSFSFLYSTFNQKFPVSAKEAVPKRTQLPSHIEANPMQIESIPMREWLHIVTAYYGVWTQLK